MSLTPAQRSTRARLAAHTRWAKTDDRQAAVKAARKGFMARFENEVDPDGVLSPAELARRADSALRAHMSRLALKKSLGHREKPNCPAPPPPPPKPSKADREVTA